MKVFAPLLVFSVFCTSLLGEPPRPAHIVVRHIESGGIGYQQGYTTLEGFLSPIEPVGSFWVPFLDLRGHLFNDGQPAANAGIGARYLGVSRVWGANAYYDYRKTNRQHYNQIAAGLESLGEMWDFRINGYLPVGKTGRSWGSSFAYFQDHFAYLYRKKELALKGVNAEAAAHFNAAKNVDVTAAMGPYYLAGRGVRAWGGEARVRIDLYQYCRLEAFTSYDSNFQWTGQGQFGIVIPFGRKREPQSRCGQSCSTAALLANRAVQPVDRFEIIPVDRKKKAEIAIDPATGAPYFFWFVNNTSNSLGNFESPFPLLVQAQNASSAGDVIYVYPGDGTSAGMDMGLTLKNHQFLFGAGIEHVIPTTRGDLAIPPQASGRPILTALAGSSVVAVANDNVISGFQMTADANGIAKGSFCIGSSAGSTNKLYVAENILTANNGAVGVIPNEPSGTVVIENNIIQSGDNQGAYGIYLSKTSGTGSYEIANNSISNFQNLTILFPSVPSGSGIAVVTQNGSNTSAVVSGNQISNCTGHSIDCHAIGAGGPVLSAVITGNRLEGVALEGVGTYFFTDDDAIAAFQVSNNHTNEFPFGMIAQAEGQSSMTGLIENNVFSNGPLGSGIILETNFITQMESATGVFTVRSNDVSRYGDAQGIATASYGTSSLTAAIEENQIYEIGEAGIYMRAFGFSSNQISIIDNVITNNNGGMELDSTEDSMITAVIERNTVTDNNGAGLFANPIMNGNSKIDLNGNIFSGNNLMGLNSGSALTVLAEDSAVVCLRMQDNQSTMEATLPDYDLENLGTGQFSVEPLINNTGTISQSGTTAVPAGSCGF